MNQSTTARFKITLHAPGVGDNSTLTIIIPHPWNATVFSLRQVALSRAAKLGFTTPAGFPEPIAHLGGADGGVLFDDDLLEELIMDPGTEEVWFVFAGIGSDGGKARRRARSLSIDGDNLEATKKRRIDKPTAGSTPVPTAAALNIRVITPELAKTKTRLEDIPPLPPQYQITDETTLERLKEIIGGHYFAVNVFPGECCGSGHVECNCLLARKLLQSGTREHVSFEKEVMVGGEGSEGDRVCDLCCWKLSEPCPRCFGTHEGESMGCGYLKHAGCEHIFHQHCSEGAGRDDKCPVTNKIHTTNTNNREYVPTNNTDRFLVVVHGRSIIHKVPLPPLPSVSGPSSASPSGLSVEYIKALLSDALGMQYTLTEKVANVFGAKIQFENAPGEIFQTNPERHSQLLFQYSCVISICSTIKHPRPTRSPSGASPIALYDLLTSPSTRGNDYTTATPRTEEVGSNSNPRGTSEGYYDIDIHTADAPIICGNKHTMLRHLHLEDCAIGGVINLFVTLRSRNDPHKPPNSSTSSMGMNEIFSNRDHWRVPVPQTERGMATFLSSTRVFAARIAKADRCTQNSVLALFMHLTHFPPILRTLHTLMTGKTLTPAESAVMVQCVYELTRELLTPGPVIANKKERVLEGSRLFYHLAIDLARYFNDPAATEYLDALKLVNLTDAETFQPLSDPITTNLGIIESAYFKALTEGMLSGLVNVTPTVPKEDELKIIKLVRRTAGVMSEVTVFDGDTLQLALQGRTNDLTSGSSSILNQSSVCPRGLNYNLRELCHHSAAGTFAVVPPIRLRSQAVREPALTLDGEGLMAVYLGRPPCAPPDKDVTIFRPIQGISIDIDVSLVTQLLEPILRQRTEDTSIELDSLGEAEAKAHRDPDEIIMLCVDCSTSMKQGFEGLNEYEEEEEASETEEEEASELDEEDANETNSEPGSLNEDLMDSDEEGAEENAYTLQQGLDILSSHENLPEIISTIRARTFNGQKRDVASRAVSTIIALYKSELKVLQSDRRQREINLTTRFLQSQAYIQGNQTVQRIDKLEKHLESLSQLNRSHLVEVLLEQAAKPTGRQNLFPSQAARLIASNSSSSSGSISTITPTDISNNSRLELPPIFQCPISHEMFETPVVAEDGFTYDKTHIERWFQTTGTNNSPMSGLPMGTLLLPNRNLATQIREWREGTDIISAGIADSSGPLPGRRTTDLVKIRMINQTCEWEFRLPKRIRYDSLRALGFRCLKGETSSFTLRHNGEPIKQEWTAPISTHTVVLKSGMIIALDKSPGAPGAGLTLGLNSAMAMGNTQAPERVLVKVYRDSNSPIAPDPAFTFWILKNTQSNIASVLFRFWTHNLGSKMTSPERFQVWVNVRYTGDGSITGQFIGGWRPLSEALRYYTIDGTTEQDDPLYQETTLNLFAVGREATAGALVPIEKSARVLKLLLIEHTSITKEPKPENIGKTLTRMDVVKQVFDNYINRTLAYNISNHIGLITFATKPTIKQPVTGVIENLRNALNQLKCEGDTAMWDAINLAAECLKTYGAKYPGAKKRIVCLSDGADTNSKVASWRLCQDLQNTNIVVDSISIGNGGNRDLMGISYGTGGYKFYPRDLESAVAICELETVLRQTERPEVPRPYTPLSQIRYPLSEFRQYVTSAAADIVNEDVYPPRKSHPNLQDEFVAISSVLRKDETVTSRNAPVQGMRLGDAGLLREMRLIASKSQPFYDVYVSESNMRFWKVVMEAPPDSTYSSGIYLLYLDMDNYYPGSAPKARFVTPILHPNINKHGRICHSILDRDWTSDTTLAALLDVIWSLLLVPNKNDFANVVTSLNYLWDEVGHQDRVREHVKKHATKTREEWKKEIVGSE